MKDLSKLIILLSVLFMVFFLEGCSTASDPEDLSKEQLELSSDDAKALNDFLQGNIEDDGVPAVSSTN